ncbi:unnamed protein product [Menidia menidia]|uniref:peptidylprolyl isomerase n=1 Tax=Menidia menidia TaxID=238744 RepID=A0A8S4AAM3_9TELE|nr:unnamed protein product [Menidia menidia]
MTKKMENMDASDGHDSVPSAKKSGQTSLLDSGEDFEVLDEEDIDDEPPPLEDAGGGKEKKDTDTKTADEEPDPSDPVDEWLDVLGNNLLKKKVLDAGKGRDSRPQKGQNVKINLKTHLMDGTLVEDQQSLAFTLGDGDVIQALDLTVQLMETGEKALVQTDAKYAYGARGSLDPGVPPGADLSLEVELLEAAEGPDLELLPPRGEDRPGQPQEGEGKRALPEGRLFVCSQLLQHRPADNRVQLQSLVVTIHAELSKLVKKNSEQRGAEQAMYKKMLGNPSSSGGGVQRSGAKSSWGLSWKWLFGATAVAIGGVALSVVIAARN